MDITLSKISVVESGLHALQISDFDTEPLATLSQSFSDVSGATYTATFYVKVGVADRDPNAYLQVSVGSDGVTVHDDVCYGFSGLQLLVYGRRFRYFRDRCAKQSNLLLPRRYLGNWSIRDSQRPRALDLGDDGGRLRYGGARPPSPRSICPCLCGELQSHQGEREVRLTCLSVERRPRSLNSSPWSLKMISLTKKSILHTVLAASLGAVCASAAGVAHAATVYEITVGEATFGPAGHLPYENGIIQNYATNLYGPAQCAPVRRISLSAANTKLTGSPATIR